MGELQMLGIDVARVRRVIAIALCGVMSSGIARPAEHGRVAPNPDGRVDQVQGEHIVIRTELAAAVAPGEP